MDSWLHILSTGAGCESSTLSFSLSSPPHPPPSLYPSLCGFKFIHQTERAFQSRGLEDKSSCGAQGRQSPRRMERRSRLGLNIRSFEHFCSAGCNQKGSGKGAMAGPALAAMFISVLLAHCTGRRASMSVIGVFVSSPRLDQCHVTWQILCAVNK